MIIELEKELVKLPGIKKSIEEMGASLDRDRLEKELNELEYQMQESGFWDNIKKAEEVTKKSKLIKDKIENFDKLKSRIEDIEVLKEIMEDDDEESANEIIQTLRDIEAQIDDYNMKVLLCGEYDKNNAILTLHVGVGGTDANDWTEMLLRMYTRWCEKQGYSIETLDLLPGDEAGIKSVTLKVTGEYAYGYLKAEKGIHRLVRISPYNANGKRQTSFASMEVLPELTKEQDIEIRSDDLKIDTYRSGGAGGQHVNKTDSAVRITHIPTGIVVQCQNERSQFSNRDTAMEMLKSKLVELKERAHKEKIEDLTGELKDMGWGSQIRSYVFHPYSMVKDHRTNVETSNVTSVMDGEIDMFINAYLKQQ
ncbi:peptide chain release factor 2 [Clostridium sp. 2-1]|uniref:peptide chain release factor 2 n=1 Tax=Clostridium sp. 2-1 TaxID=2070758 RepID=UPI000CDABDA9|nr:MULTISPECIES: peptide chain release factor 2 [Clostridium]MBN7574708.1 peptide chain release factor 2 [Clostridium beijerinckii]MBN7579968.1 peptide chain release factor 2 [Clostridium beijerinckii]MBN7584473.1 peptide chain release factor 2 [Clostridium beijerinckii]MBO0522363.1 peptide chain release factor 2 [Clostridium beijerinckii]MZK53050.1 peptide chain release factor 2 [Clostridium beijerinckii]